MFPELTVVSPKPECRFTLEEFELLPPPEGEFEHFELLAGELIVVRGVPRLPHQEVIGNLHWIWRRHLHETGAGTVWINSTGIVLGTDTALRPDLLVVLRENDAILCDDSIHGAPDLVVEVLSPGTARYDLVGKRAAYERYGVREYWVVDVKARTLLQLVLAEGRYRETLHAADAVFRPAILPELEVRLAEVWPLPR